jgi:hypothetical protein
MIRIAGHMVVVRWNDDNKGIHGALTPVEHKR